MKNNIITTLEKFIINNNSIKIQKPFDDIEVININGKNIYVLFGDVDYYENKEAILAIKGKSNSLILNNQSYKKFLNEFKSRFNNIEELKNSDLLISIETTSNINDDLINTINKPHIENGFKKKDPSFKMKDINKNDRSNLKDLFDINFKIDNRDMCVIDDFITTGTTFKNSFDLLPGSTNVCGVCLFKLVS